MTAGRRQQPEAAEVDKQAAALQEDRRPPHRTVGPSTDIKADLAWCGRDGSPTKVQTHSIQRASLKKASRLWTNEFEEGITKMSHELIVDHTLG